MRQEMTKGRLDGPFLFIVNPNSGRGNHQAIAREIIGLRSKKSIELVTSLSPEHSVMLARSAHESGYKAVVAVGGDGSVHECGTQLIGSEVPLGIIPAGSGNGVARHLGISMDMSKAVDQVIRGKWRTIDTLIVNSRPAIGFAGVGFDGYIAQQFKGRKNRGFGGYVKVILDSVNSYGSSHFTTASGRGQNQKSLLFSILCANISQLGNNAYINPGCNDADGLFECIAIKPLSPAQFPALGSRLFLKNFHRSPMVDVKKLNKLSIINEGGAFLQIDGEPAGQPATINIEIVPKSLRVIVP